jgi:hypothetical protein
MGSFTTAVCQSVAARAVSLTSKVGVLLNNGAWTGAAEPARTDLSSTKT